MVNTLKGLRKSPLQSPINTAQINRIFVFDRPPLSTDYKNFRITDTWVHREPSADPPYGVYVLVDKPAGSGVWIQVGGSTIGDIQSITGDSGDPIIPDDAGNVNIIGENGVTTSGTGDTLTISIPSSTLTWIEDTTTPISVNVNEGHFAASVGQIIYNMPVTTVVGDSFAFFDVLGNGFQIQLQAGQTIRIGNQVTSSGGTITSTAIGDALFFVCSTANTTFMAHSSQGNLTIA